MFEQAFRNIDDILHKEAWLHHRTRLHRADVLAAVPEVPRRPRRVRQGHRGQAGRQEVRLHPRQALPLGKPGLPPRARTASSTTTRPSPATISRDFVNGKLFPYLHWPSSRRRAGRTPSSTRSAKSSGRSRTSIQSGYNLREIIDHIDELRFRSQKEKHELSHLYEAKIRNMGNAGRNGGEYYTPRPLIRAIVQV
jgi:type I restriction enzyme M protein